MNPRLVSLFQAVDSEVTAAQAAAEEQIRQVRAEAEARVREIEAEVEGRVRWTMANAEARIKKIRAEAAEQIRQASVDREIEARRLEQAKDLIHERTTEALDLKHRLAKAEQLAQELTSQIIEERQKHAAEVKKKDEEIEDAKYKYGLVDEERFNLEQQLQKTNEAHKKGMSKARRLVYREKRRRVEAEVYATEAWHRKNEEEVFQEADKALIEERLVCPYCRKPDLEKMNHPANLNACCQCK